MNFILNGIWSLFLVTTMVPILAHAHHDEDLRPSLSCLLAGDIGCKCKCGILCKTYGCVNWDPSCDGVYCDCKEQWEPIYSEPEIGKEFKGLEDFDDILAVKFRRTPVFLELEDTLNVDPVLMDEVLYFLLHTNGHGKPLKDTFRQTFPELDHLLRRLRPRILENQKRTSGKDIPNEPLGNLEPSTSRWGFLSNWWNRPSAQSSNKENKDNIIERINGIEKKEDLLDTIQMLKDSGDTPLYKDVTKHFLKNGLIMADGTRIVKPISDPKILKKSMENDDVLHAIEDKINKEKALRKEKKKRLQNSQGIMPPKNENTYPILEQKQTEDVKSPEPKEKQSGYWGFSGWFSSKPSVSETSKGEEKPVPPVNKPVHQVAQPNYYTHDTELSEYEEVSDPHHYDDPDDIAHENEYGYHGDVDHLLVPENNHQPYHNQWGSSSPKNDPDLNRNPETINSEYEYYSHDSPEHSTQLNYDEYEYIPLSEDINYDGDSFAHILAPDQKQSQNIDIHNPHDAVLNNQDYANVKPSLTNPFENQPEINPAQHNINPPEPDWFNFPWDQESQQLNSSSEEQFLENDKNSGADHSSNQPLVNYNHSTDTPTTNIKLEELVSSDSVAPQEVTSPQILPSIIIPELFINEKLPDITTLPSDSPLESTSNDSSDDRNIKFFLDKQPAATEKPTEKITPSSQILAPDIIDNLSASVESDEDESDGMLQNLLKLAKVPVNDSKLDEDDLETMNLGTRNLPSNTGDELYLSNFSEKQLSEPPSSNISSPIDEFPDSDYVIERTHLNRLHGITPPSSESESMELVPVKRIVRKKKERPLNPKPVNENPFVEEAFNENHSNGDLPSISAIPQSMFSVQFEGLEGSPILQIDGLPFQSFDSKMLGNGELPFPKSSTKLPSSAIEVPKVKPHNKPGIPSLDMPDELSNFSPLNEVDDLNAFAEDVDEDELEHYLEIADDVAEKQNPLVHQKLGKHVPANTAVNMDKSVMPEINNLNALHSPLQKSVKNKLEPKLQPHSNSSQKPDNSSMDLTPETYFPGESQKNIPQYQQGTNKFPENVKKMQKEPINRPLIPVGTNAGGAGSFNESNAKSIPPFTAHEIMDLEEILNPKKTLGLPTDAVGYIPKASTPASRLNEKPKNIKSDQPNLLNDVTAPPKDKNVENYQGPKGKLTKGNDNHPIYPETKENNEKYYNGASPKPRLDSRPKLPEKNQKLSHVDPTADHFNEDVPTFDVVNDFEEKPLDLSPMRKNGVSKPIEPNFEKPSIKTSNKLENIPNTDISEYEIYSDESDTINTVIPQISKKPSEAYPPHVSYIDQTLSDMSLPNEENETISTNGWYPANVSTPEESDLTDAINTIRPQKVFPQDQINSKLPPKAILPNKDTSQLELEQDGSDYDFFQNDENNPTILIPSAPSNDNILSTDKDIPNLKFKNSKNVLPPPVQGVHHENFENPIPTSFENEVKPLRAPTKKSTSNSPTMPPVQSGVSKYASKGLNPPFFDKSGKNPLIKMSGTSTGGRKIKPENTYPSSSSAVSTPAKTVDNQMKTENIEPDMLTDLKFMPKDKKKQLNDSIPKVGQNEQNMPLVPRPVLVSDKLSKSHPQLNQGNANGLPQLFTNDDISQISSNEELDFHDYLKPHEPIPTKKYNKFVNTSDSFLEVPDDRMKNFQNVLDDKFDNSRQQNKDSEKDNFSGIDDIVENRIPDYIAPKHEGHKKDKIPAADSNLISPKRKKSSSYPGTGQYNNEPSADDINSSVFYDEPNFDTFLEPPSFNSPQNYMKVDDDIDLNSILGIDSSNQFDNHLNDTFSDETQENETFHNNLNHLPEGKNLGKNINTNVIPLKHEKYKKIPFQSNPEKLDKSNLHPNIEGNQQQPSVNFDTSSFLIDDEPDFDDFHAPSAITPDGNDMKPKNEDTDLNSFLGINGLDELEDLMNDKFSGERSQQGPTVTEYDDFSGLNDLEKILDKDNIPVKHQKVVENDKPITFNPVSHNKKNHKTASPSLGIGENHPILYNSDDINPLFPYESSNKFSNENIYEPTDSSRVPLEPNFDDFFISPSNKPHTDDIKSKNEDAGLNSFSGTDDLNLLDDLLNSSFSTEKEMNGRPTEELDDFSGLGNIMGNPNQNDFTLEYKKYGPIEKEIQEFPNLVSQKGANPYPEYEDIDGLEQPSLKNENKMFPEQVHDFDSIDNKNSEQPIGNDFDWRLFLGTNGANNLDNLLDDSFSNGKQQNDNIPAKFDDLLGSDDDLIDDKNKIKKPPARVNNSRILNSSKDFPANNFAPGSYNLSVNGNEPLLKSKVVKDGPLLANQNKSNHPNIISEDILPGNAEVPNNIIEVPASRKLRKPGKLKSNKVDDFQPNKIDNSSKGEGSIIETPPSSKTGKPQKTEMKKLLPNDSYHPSGIIESKSMTPFPDDAANNLKVEKPAHNAELDEDISQQLVNDFLKSQETEAENMPPIEKLFSNLWMSSDEENFPTPAFESPINVLNKHMKESISNASMEVPLVSTSFPPGDETLPNAEIHDFSASFAPLLHKKNNGKKTDRIPSNNLFSDEENLLNDFINSESEKPSKKITNDRIGNSDMNGALNQEVPVKGMFVNNNLDDNFNDLFPTEQTWKEIPAFSEIEMPLDKKRPPQGGDILPTAVNENDREIPQNILKNGKKFPKTLAEKLNKNSPKSSVENKNTGTRKAKKPSGSSLPSQLPKISDTLVETTPDNEDFVDHNVFPVASSVKPIKVIKKDSYNPVSALDEIIAGDVGPGENNLSSTPKIPSFSNQAQSQFSSHVIPTAPEDNNLDRSFIIPPDLLSSSPSFGQKSRSENETNLSKIPKMQINSSPNDEPYIIDEISSNQSNNLPSDSFQNIFNDNKDIPKEDELINNLEKNVLVPEMSDTISDKDLQSVFPASNRLKNRKASKNFLKNQKSGKNILQPESRLETDLPIQKSETNAQDFLPTTVGKNELFDSNIGPGIDYINPPLEPIENIKSSLPVKKKLRNRPTLKPNEPFQESDVPDSNIFNPRLASIDTLSNAPLTGVIASENEDRDTNMRPYNEKLQKQDILSLPLINSDAQMKEYPPNKIVQLNDRIPIMQKKPKKNYKKGTDNQEPLNIPEISSNPEVIESNQINQLIGTHESDIPDLTVHKLQNYDTFLPGDATKVEPTMELTTVSSNPDEEFTIPVNLNLNQPNYPLKHTPSNKILSRLLDEDIPGYSSNNIPENDVLKNILNENKYIPEKDKIISGNFGENLLTPSEISNIHGSPVEQPTLLESTKRRPLKNSLKNQKPSKVKDLPYRQPEMIIQDSLPMTTARNEFLESNIGPEADHIGSISKPIENIISNIPSKKKSQSKPTLKQGGLFQQSNLPNSSASDTTVTLMDTSPSTFSKEPVIPSQKEEKPADVESEKEKRLNLPPILDMQMEEPVPSATTQSNNQVPVVQKKPKKKSKKGAGDQISLIIPEVSDNSKINVSDKIPNEYMRESDITNLSQVSKNMPSEASIANDLLPDDTFTPFLENGEAQLGSVNVENLKLKKFIPAEQSSTLNPKNIDFPTGESELMDDGIPHINDDAVDNDDLKYEKLSSNPNIDDITNWMVENFPQENEALTERVINTSPKTTKQSKFNHPNEQMHQSFETVPGDSASQILVEDARIPLVLETQELAEISAPKFDFEDISGISESNNPMNTPLGIKKDFNTLFENTNPFSNNTDDNVIFPEQPKTTPFLHDSLENLSVSKKPVISQKLPAQEQIDSQDSGEEDLLQQIMKNWLENDNRPASSPIPSDNDNASVVPSNSPLGFTSVDDNAELSEIKNSNLPNSLDTSEVNNVNIVEPNLDFYIDQLQSAVKEEPAISGKFQSQDTSYFPTIPIQEEKSRPLKTKPLMKKPKTKNPLLLNSSDEIFKQNDEYNTLPASFGPLETEKKINEFSVPSAAAELTTATNQLTESLNPILESNNLKDIPRKMRKNNRKSAGNIASKNPSASVPIIEADSKNPPPTVPVIEADSFSSNVLSSKPENDLPKEGMLKITSSTDLEGSGKPEQTFGNGFERILDPQNELQSSIKAAMKSDPAEIKLSENISAAQSEPKPARIPNIMDLLNPDFQNNEEADLQNNAEVLPLNLQDALMGEPPLSKDGTSETVRDDLPDLPNDIRFSIDNETGEISSIVIPAQSNINNSLILNNHILADTNPFEKEAVLDDSVPVKITETLPNVFSQPVENSRNSSITKLPSARPTQSKYLEEKFTPPSSKSLKRSKTLMDMLKTNDFDITPEVDFSDEWANQNQPTKLPVESSLPTNSSNPSTNGQLKSNRKPSGPPPIKSGPPQPRPQAGHVRPLSTTSAGNSSKIKNSNVANGNISNTNPGILKPNLSGTNIKPVATNAKPTSALPPALPMAGGSSGVQPQNTKKLISPKPVKMLSQQNPGNLQSLFKIEESEESPPSDSAPDNMQQKISDIMNSFPTETEDNLLSPDAFKIDEPLPIQISQPLKPVTASKPVNEVQRKPMRSINGSVGSSQSNQESVPSNVSRTQKPPTRYKSPTISKPPTNSKSPSIENLPPPSVNAASISPNKPIATTDSLDFDDPFLMFEEQLAKSSANLAIPASQTEKVSKVELDDFDSFANILTDEDKFTEQELALAAKNPKIRPDILISSQNAGNTNPPAVRRAQKPKFSVKKG